MNKLFYSFICLLIALLSLVCVCAVDVDSCSCEGNFSESHAEHVVLDENCTSAEINSLAVCNLEDNPNNDEYNDGSTLNSKGESFKTQSYSATKDSSANSNLVKDVNNNKNTFKELNNNNNKK